MQETMVDYKQNIYQELSRLTKGIGSEKRLDILNILSQGPKTVEGIAHATGLSVANTSRHLQVLKESHLVVTSRNGNFIRFKTLELGYSFPHCRIYFSGDNLAVWSPFKLWDPELSWNSYPLQRTFNIGVQVNI